MAALFTALLTGVLLFFAGGEKEKDKKENILLSVEYIKRPS